MIKGNSCTVFCSSSLQHMTVLLKNRIKSRAKKGRLFILFLKIRYFNSFITCSELLFRFVPCDTELGSRLKSLFVATSPAKSKTREAVFGCLFLSLDAGQLFHDLFASYISLICCSDNGVPNGSFSFRRSLSGASTPTLTTFSMGTL